MIPVPPQLVGIAAKPAIKMLKWLVPLLAVLGLCITVYILNTKLANRTGERDVLQTWQDDILNVIRAEIPVGRRKSVNKDTGADEVRWLGREYRQLNVDLQRMSKMLLEASDKATLATNAATEARKRAVEANKGREATRQRLIAPGRSTGLTEAEWSQL